MTQQKRATGQKLAPLSERLARIGLVRDWDFVLHLPLRYEDETRIVPIGEVLPGQTVQIQGEVTDCRVVRGRFEQLVARVADRTDSLQVRFLHFYPSQRAQMAEGNTVRLYGEVRAGYGGVLEMVHPKVKKGLSAGDTLPSTLTPIYPAGEGIAQHWLRKRIDRALLDVDLKDIVPKELTEPLGLPGLSEALRALHHPKPGADQRSHDERTTPEWQRLKFDELLAQQISLRQSRVAQESLRAPAHPETRGMYVKALAAALPFELTGAQKRVWNEIAADLRLDRPMHRLVQGDVGSGKTVIAALAAAMAVDNGYQAALMAPTELLAEQHYQKLTAWLEPLGMRIAWLSGSLKPKQKQACHERIQAGEVDLVIGTHALIQDAVRFSRLSVAIVDEQHRFGVAQRLKLRQTNPNGDEGVMPHLLMLSATPIPRTLAMTYLADMDVSVIDELPPGRTPITTTVVSMARRAEVIAAIGRILAQGQQCYWVCPLINESEKADLTAATIRADELIECLPQARIGLVHGEMTAEHKQNVMSAFARAELDILVATTVIEVGVDVPNACVMVIEHAERFGLAQLHQLRGRVGRGTARSFCLLLYDPELSETGRQRLSIIKDNTDGFVIAREDLRLRGPGEFLGARQSGLPMLRFADLESDESLLEAARNGAERWMREDPTRTLEHARRWFSSRESFLDA
ncbi:MAG: ATP-dependent DNA helicase RecG [Duodenibacillus sp.]|nr:ATP-dependent DNA helicase RecG [Duodenibacillus sp.]